MSDLIEPSTPYPPRFWWLKRLAVISFALIIGYIALMRWWQHEADRRLAAEVAQLHAAGERVLLEDFTIAPISDDENGALSLISAARSIALAKPDQRFVDNFNRNATIDARTLQQMKAIAQTSAAARTLARQARFQPKTDWGYVFASPVINIMLPSLHPQRELANLLSVNVAFEHAAGNDAESIEIVRDMLSASDRMNHNSPMLVSHLVGIGLNVLTADTIRSISHDLPISPDPQATTMPTGPASREQVKALINELLHEQLYRDGFSSAMEGERLMEYDTSVNFVGGIAPTIPRFGLPRPMLMLDGIRMMRHTTQVQTAARAADYQSARKLSPKSPRAGPGSSAITFGSRLLSQILMPSMERAMTVHFRGLTERRVAALRLAIRLYQIDHEDRLPSRLEDLVPNYISSLPSDPFRSDGKPLGYAPSAALLYSVGEGGIDDGGSTALPGRLQNKPNEGAVGEWDDRFRWDRADVIFPLTKPAPASQPSSDED